MSTSVTVYISSHNYGKFLKKSIDSVIMQTFQDWELFIIDDCSSDDTIKIAKEFLNKNNFKIQLIENKKNKGIQKIANDIAKRASGKYILRLDADDYLHHEALEKLFNKLESHPEASLVYSNFYYIDEIDNIIGVESSSKRVSDGEDIDLVAPHGACSLIRLDLFKKVGGYDESIDAQDGWDIWYKLNQIGKCIKLEDSLFYYRQHSSSLSKDHDRLIRARNKIIDKNLSFKKDTVNPNCYCVIPIKSTFPKLPSESIINGLDLTLQTIRQALMVEYVDKVIISTESESVVEELSNKLSSLELSDIIFIFRSKSESLSKSVPIIGIINNAKEELTKQKIKIPNYWLYLGLMAKHREVAHIYRAFSLVDNFNYDCLLGVVEERSPVFQMGKGSLEILNPGRFSNLDYHDEKILRYNGSIILLRDQSMQTNNFLSGKVGYLEMTQSESVEWA